MQSILVPAGPQAAAIAWLWWVMFWVCAAVFVSVLFVLAGAVVKSSRHRPQIVATHRRLSAVVGSATGLTILILIGLLGASIMTGRATQSIDRTNALAIVVTANQWWWSVEYAFPTASERVRTANEIHLPRGRTAVVTLASNDVIHSFWVPTLHGKVDLIPGRLTEIVIRGDEPGVYRGQCAEYCGAQHAHMALIVRVEEPSVFEAWLNGQRQSSVPPDSDLTQRGKMLLEKTSCSLCHTVRGTIAGARTAPDLTHVATRDTLAAGILPNTEEALHRWLRDPQAVKPGNKMPNPGLPDADRNAIVAYLRGLR